MAIPKVFISYSHDSDEHKSWVLEIATKLRRDGVDATLDQWDLQAGGDLPRFMEDNLRDSDYILMVCTEAYVEKADSGQGGVGYEKMIVTADLMKNIGSSKFVPVIRQNGTHQVPTFLGSKKYIDLSKSADVGFGYDELLRTVLGSPLYVKPPVGSNPFPSTEKVAPKQSKDALMDLMTKAISDYELGKNYSMTTSLKSHMGISRIMFDILLGEATSKGLLLDHGGHVTLTSKGKSYAVENNLIK